VGLCVPRGAAMIAGMLGILRAGGSYVPMPPAYPAERIRLMLEDSNAAAVLAQGPGLQALSKFAPARPVLDLDAVLDPREPAPDAPPCASPDAESAAYIIYTSGSTGTPKGTLVSHRSIHNLVLSLRRDLQGPDDVVAQLADYAFDAATFEIWGTLLTGGTIAIIEGNAVTEPERLEVLLREHAVTTAFFTTSLFNLIAELRPQALASLHNIATGGEKFNWSAFQRVMIAAPDLRLWHVYGPTECTCFSTGFLCTPRCLETGVLPIGRPLINYTAYVLDENRKLLPPGVPGELHIGGDGVALGYLNRPELTGARFVPNPFADADDLRANRNTLLYRTGDSVRWLEDGNIEFLGRFDQQAKVRGFRVELGEIEAALARCPAVASAVVTVREQPGGEKQLVGWATPASDTDPQPDELRQFLQQTLPPYMIPDRLVVVDRLPLTSSGKIDRFALPEPPADTPSDDGEELTTPLTSQLIEIWQDLLGVNPISTRQDFFALGGHSLLAVRMVTRVAEILGHPVPVSMLFGSPTIGQLAAALAKEYRPRQPVTEVQPGAGRRPLFFFDGDWLGGGLYCRNLARLIDHERPFYVVSPHGLDGKPVPGSVEAMAADRVGALLAVQSDGPFLLGGYCAGGLVALEMAHQLRARGHAVPTVVLLDSVADQQGGIPWRVLQRRRRDLDWQLSGFARQWSQKDWRGRMSLVGESVRRRVAPKEAAVAVAATTGVWTMDWTQGPAQEYLRSLSHYRLKPYAGKVTLLLTTGHPWDLDPESPWRKVVPNLDVHWVPGNHTTALAAHAESTAKAFRAALERAEATLL
jgi:amino acid adenylation domain-containing protein